MKKILMIFGLALVAGVGVFTLTDGFANEGIQDLPVAEEGCGCEKCGTDCSCGEGVHCGASDCGCSSGVSDCKAKGACSASASCGSSSCGVELSEEKPCGCGK